VTGVDQWQRGEPEVSVWPRRFALHRWYDPTEVSGTGVVAFGTVYPSGRTTLAWCSGEVTSVTVYDSPEQVEQIHGHGGYTDLVWLDPAPTTPAMSAEGGMPESRRTV
jgi:hypothetical protein